MGTVLGTVPMSKSVIFAPFHALLEYKKFVEVT